MIDEKYLIECIESVSAIKPVGRRLCRVTAAELFALRDAAKALVDLAPLLRRAVSETERRGRLGPMDDTVDGLLVAWSAIESRLGGAP